MKSIAGFWVGLALPLYLASQPADATTIDTFQFSQQQYLQFGNPGGFVGMLTGTFTGAVEPSGLIELADLSAFNAVFSIQFTTISFTFTTPALFSYNTNGGPGSLDIEAMFEGNNLCIGAAAAFGACNTPSNVSPINGILSQGVIPAQAAILFYSQQQPSVTLVSSVSTGTTPLPSTWLMFLSGLGALALLGVFRRAKFWMPARSFGS